MNKKEIQIVQNAFEERETWISNEKLSLVNGLFMIQNPEHFMDLNIDGNEKRLHELMLEKIKNKEWRFPDDEETIYPVFTKNVSQVLEAKIIYRELIVTDPYSFRVLYNKCRYMQTKYKFYAKSNPEEINIDIFLKMESHLFFLYSELAKLAVHWHTQLAIKREMSNRAKPGADEMRRKKLDRVKKVKDILPKYPSYKTDKQQRVALFSEAITATDCLSSKSIENYLKELEIDKEE